MKFDSLYHPNPAYRVPVYGSKGMVATSQPLAAQIGLDIMKKGGNAVDAAIATAAALTVLEPSSNGIGGDAFAIVWMNGQLHGLNASGPAPKSISIDAIKKQGYTKIPQYGPIPVTVPGAPAAWSALSRRFGKLPLIEVLEPAIHYASEGFPLSPVTANNWSKAALAYQKENNEQLFSSWFNTFAPNGVAPKAGEIWRSPNHAKTLRKIAETEAKCFYEGEIAQEIVRYVQSLGGYLQEEDLKQFEPEWVKPISVDYRGYEVWELPPNGQGLVALQALNILKQYDGLERSSVDTFHTQIEAIKLAFADGQHYITDSSSMKITVEELLSESYAKWRKNLITEEAIIPEAGKPSGGGTVYLATADSEGNMVSFIQSNFMQFGSGLVVPETGIALQNRGFSFSLDEDHSNSLQPGKRTYHTIIPGFLTRANGTEAVGPFGVMGGLMQPQGHVQAIMNTIDFNLHPQAALDAPRWQWTGGKDVLVEPTFPVAEAQALARKGHHIQYAIDNSSFGRGQIIWREHTSGVLCGGTDSRADGSIAVW